MRRALVVGLVTIVAALCMSTALASAKTSSEHKGCRLFAVGYDKTVPQVTRDTISFKGYTKLQASKIPSLRAIFQNSHDPLFSANLASWCLSHYPHDRAIQETAWPTGPVS